ncbi:hypothetical protein FEP94_03145 [Burkholderia pseudomultivorans]|uniref:Polysaccharide biosynthesis protein n=2 Tax=Burkholderia pseudomultivorans TaxID=1207504 RepID=A0ABU2E2P3_9BURK|nr:hypothetical protein [Burkholderia pseudomultivorans]MDR8736325.1 hypothetical protein [Burkholderia pseudomultivorans]MDR8742139.1 hypothetical protein [Burkholderia pseudomultivorans]MDR8753923.1 hypothetical protein [Burkholderia pseudomultivorans]MDR8778967.1 hypothetical protein [Burkholderia pseudomultivorans]
MSPTLGRAASRYKSGNSTLSEFSYLVRFSDIIFMGTAVLFVVCSIPAAGWVASNWLKVHFLRIDDIKFSIVVMLVAVAIRWRTQPHRSIIIGMEQQVWLNSFNAVIVSFRTVGAALLVVFLGSGIRLFFFYQLIIAIVEAIGMFWKVRKLVPRNTGRSRGMEGKPDLSEFWKMSLTLMLTTAAWTVLTQLDRLILSKKIALADFGVFSMAVLCASGVAILGGPITSVLGPRLTILLEKKDHAGALTLYRKATRFSVSIVLNAAITLAFFSHQIIWIWCNNKELAGKAAPVFMWYVLGNGVQAMTALFYTLQYAHGRLRLHLIGYLALTAIVTPTVLWAASNYGAIGTGKVWFAQSILYLLGWGWLVHFRFLPGYYLRWIAVDIVAGAIPVIVVAWLLSHVPIPWEQSRLFDIAYFSGYIIICILVSFAGNADVRLMIKRKLHAFRFCFER